MKRKLRVGMVGGGPSGGVGSIHRAALRLNDEAELVAGAFSSVKERSLQMGKELAMDLNRIYADYEEMAEKEATREDCIDFAIITTPNVHHYPAAKAFLQKGIHVSCEKPLCFTVEQGLELKRLAQENGCLFCVTHTFTGHVMSREARALYRQGTIGNIRMAVVEYPQDWLLDALENVTEETRTWRSDPALSGRGAAIADIGSHMENWVNYVTGLKVTKVSAHLDIFGEGNTLDNNFEVVLKYDNGAKGVFWGSQVAIGFDNAFKVRLLGDKGTIEFVQEENNYLKLYLRGEPPRILSRGCKYNTQETLKYVRVPCGHPEGLVEAFGNIYRSFCAAIQDKMAGKTVVEDDYGYPTVDMGIDGVRFFNACIDSHEANNAWMAIER